MISKLHEWQTDARPPTLSEIVKAISKIMWGRVPRPDGLVPEIFEDDSPVLAVRLTEILVKISGPDVTHLTGLDRWSSQFIKQNKHPFTTITEQYVQLI